jgi:hypothetical protein
MLTQVATSRFILTADSLPRIFGFGVSTTRIYVEIPNAMGSVPCRQDSKICAWKFKSFYSEILRNLLGLIYRGNGAE